MGNLYMSGERGITWKELSLITGWHHGTASGALSVLHKDGKIARLTQKRDKCRIYVLPEFVYGRETDEQGRVDRAEAMKEALIARLESLRETIDAHYRIQCDPMADGMSMDEWVALVQTHKGCDPIDDLIADLRKVEI